MVYVEKLSLPFSQENVCMYVCVFHSYMDGNKKSLNVMVFELYMCCCKLQYDSNVFYTYNLENVYENRNIMYTAAICMWSACLGWSNIYQNIEEFKIFFTDTIFVFMYNSCKLKPKILTRNKWFPFENHGNQINISFLQLLLCKNFFSF